VDLGVAGYAIEDRRTGERSVLPPTGEMDAVFAGFLGVTDRDRVDDLAEEILDDNRPADAPYGFDFDIRGSRE
jgi:hypothetical protein